jgi:hypothetical protein
MPIGLWDVKDPTLSRHENSKGGCLELALMLMSG